MFKKIVKRKIAKLSAYMSIVALPAPMAAVSRYLWGVKACTQVGLEKMMIALFETLFGTMIAIFEILSVTVIAMLVIGDTELPPL